MFLRALAQTARLHLALFDLSPDALPAPFQCSITPLRPASAAHRGKIRNALADLCNPLPRMVRDGDLDENRATVRALGTFDAVFAYRVDFAHYAGVLKHPRLLLDVDDPEHVRWRRRAEASQTAIDWRSERDLQKLRQFEIDAVGGAAHAFVCQEGDRALFPSRNVTVIPNGVEVRAARPAREHSADDPVPRQLCGRARLAEPRRARMVCAIDLAVDRARCPTAECQVAGRMENTLVDRLAKIPNLRAIGFVESLAGAFSGARLSIAPLRFGTGTRIKILDSFAQACPVVSTVAGADGLAVTAGRDILLADDPKSFGDHCVSLLENEAARAVDRRRRLPACCGEIQHSGDRGHAL